MARMTYEEFEKMNQSQAAESSNKSAVGYFALADDGNEAIVRFNVADINDVYVYSKHNVKINGKRRSVMCLKDDTSSCPLCDSGDRPSFRVYIPVIWYEVQINQNGEKQLVIKSGIWDQPARFRETLKSYFMDYGDLRNYVFKVVRHGKKGDTNTNYVILPTPTQVYNPEIYVPDFSAFEGFDIHRFVLLKKSAADMQTYLTTGEFPFNVENKNSENAQQFTSSQPAVQLNTQPAYTGGYAAPTQTTPVNPNYSNYTAPNNSASIAANTAPVSPLKPATLEVKADNPSGPRRYVY